MNKLPIESEVLSVTDRYNEYVMTGLRTIWGVSLEKIKTDFGPKYVTYIQTESEKYIQQKLLYVEANTLKTTKEGAFLVDGIAAHLFLLN